MMRTYARRAAAGCVAAVLAASLAACGAEEESPSDDPVLGAWLDRRLLALDALLAETVPITLERGPDGAIAGTRPYTLHGESPCGTIAITVRPADAVPTSDTGGARDLHAALPAEAAGAARFYLGEARYPEGCGYAGPLRVPTVVALAPDEPAPSDAAGPGLLHWCTPDATGAPVCTAHVRR